MTLTTRTAALALAALAAVPVCAAEDAPPQPRNAAGPDPGMMMAVLRAGDPQSPRAAAFCIDRRGWLVAPLVALADLARPESGRPGGPAPLSLVSAAFDAPVAAEIALVLEGPGLVLVKSAEPFPAAFGIAGSPSAAADPPALEILCYDSPAGPGPAPVPRIAAYPCRIAAADSGGTPSAVLVAPKFPALSGGPVVGPGMAAHGMHLAGPGRGLRAFFVPASAIGPLVSGPLVAAAIRGIPPAPPGGPALAARVLANPMFDVPDRAWLRFKFPEDRGARMDLARSGNAFEGRFALPDPALTYHREEIRLELFWERDGMAEPASAGVFPVSWEGPPSGPAQDPEGPNLAPNPGFEAGAGSAPAGWNLKLYGGFDGLTTFWEKEEGRGMVVRADTDVLADEAYARWKEMELPEAERPKPRRKTPPGERDQYKTVGANDGVHVVSDFIPVARDTEYFLSVDVFTAKTGVKVFVDGYVSHGGRDRIVYRNQKSVGESPDERKFQGSWHAYEWRFHPTRTDKGMPLLTEKIRIKLYAYWPRGEARFDDVVLRAAGKRSAPSAQALDQPQRPFRKNPKIQEEDLGEDE